MKKLERNQLKELTGGARTLEACYKCCHIVNYGVCFEETSTVPNHLQCGESYQPTSCPI